MKRLAMLMSLLALGLLLGCDKKDDGNTQAESAQAEAAPEPDYCTVQHILIGFQNSIPGKNITRTKEEASKLAYEIYERAKKGEDFDALVKEYTDDAHPGKYKMANFGVPGDPAQQIYERAKMVKAFGDVGFPLEVGGIGIADHDPVKSPYGWHIIKRLQ